MPFADPHGPTSRRQAALAIAAGHGATVTITVLQAFILLPLSLSLLGAQVLGAWLAASEVLIWMQLIDLGLPQLLTQRVGTAIGRGDRALAARWSATAAMLLAGIACVLLVAGLLAAPVITSWVGVPAGDRPQFIWCFRIAACASAAILLFSGVLGLSRGLQQPATVQTAQVAGVAAGLLSSLLMLLAGWGLWALAGGLVVRAVVSFAGALVFIRRLPNAVAWLLRPSPQVLKECVRLGPPMAAGSLGNVLAQNAELLIVASFVGPAHAAVYGLTRRAIDGVKNLLDAFAIAVAGGIAHLVSAPDRSRARTIVRDTLWLRVGTACVAAAATVPVNGAFVSLLFGADSYGGLALTLAFAVQMVVGGQATLLNILLRAVGRIRQGNWLLCAESLLRVAAMPVGLAVAGLQGVPLSGVLIGLASVVVNYRGLTQALPHADNEQQDTGISFMAMFVPPVVLACGLGVALWRPPSSWTDVALTTGSVLAIGAWALWATRPRSLTRLGR